MLLFNIDRQYCGNVVLILIDSHCLEYVAQCLPSLHVSSCNTDSNIAAIQQKSRHSFLEYCMSILQKGFLHIIAVMYVVKILFCSLGYTWELSFPCRDLPKTLQLLAGLDEWVHEKIIHAYCQSYSIAWPFFWPLKMEWSPPKELEPDFMTVTWYEQEMKKICIPV